MSNYDNCLNIETEEGCKFFGACKQFVLPLTQHVHVELNFIFVYTLLDPGLAQF